MNRLTEYLIEQLSKTKLFEMAFSRGNYLTQIGFIAKQIAENWCLVRYCSLYDKDNINKDHWKTELLAHCSNLSSMVVSTDKRKATEYGFLTMCEYDDPAVIRRVVQAKFKKEGFNLSPDIYAAFAEHGIYKLIYLISSKSSSSVEDEMYRYIDEDI